MHIVATVLFALAGIVGLTPALALLTFWYRFPGWLDDLSRYETLLGALMFAASLALIGAVLTSWNRRIISNRQIATKRREQELALDPKKFIDEIDAILSELHQSRMRFAPWNHAQEKSTSEGPASDISEDFSTGAPVTLDFFLAPSPKG
jgi:hypothetical protein